MLLLISATADMGYSNYENALAIRLWPLALGGWYALNSFPEITRIFLCEGRVPSQRIW